MISSTNDPKQEIYSEDSAWATIVSAALAIPHRMTRRLRTLAEKSLTHPSHFMKQQATIAKF